MKQITFICGLLFMLAIASCYQKESTNTSTEKVVVPPDTAPKDGTTIKVNDRGMSVESKDGSKKTNVSVSKDSANIEINKPK
jgi:hypothetical protein